MNSHRWMPALKLFLPSWEFFNDFTSTPRMEYQLIGPGAAATDWRPLFTNHTTRSLGRMLFNARGNLDLLEESLVDGAISELSLQPPAARDAFSATEMFATLVRMARARLSAQADSSNSHRFRFRLITTEPGAAPTIMFTSDEMPLKHGDA